MKSDRSIEATIERLKATPPAQLVNLPRAYAVMKEQRLDAMVATTHRNLYYLSSHMPDSVLGDFQDLNAAAILPADPSVPGTLVASDYDLAYLITHPTWLPQLRMFGAKERSSATFLLEVLSKGIGIETPLREPLRASYAATRPTVEADVNAALARALRDTLPDTGQVVVAFDDLRVGYEMRRRLGDRLHVVDALHHFRKIRMVKTPAEIALLRKASEINDVAVMEAAQAATAGRPLSDMVNAYRMAMVRQGGAFMGRRGMMFGAGPDGGFVLDNNYAEQKILAKGDSVVFDCVGKYELYHCDIARTGIVEELSPRMSELHAVVREGLAAAEAKLRPGANTEDSKAAAAAVLRKHGLSLDLTTLAWHNVGLDITEYAHPSERTLGWIVEPGMVMNFEVFHRDPDVGGVHLEDSILVTADGIEFFSTLPRDVIVTGARK